MSIHNACAGAAETRRPVVMVVDDNPKNVELLGSHLETAGYEVRKAGSGPECLRMAAIEPPDLVVLDIMMPQMDGYEVCRALKESEETMGIPVVMLTALQSLQDRLKSLDAGADDFISKPYHKIEVITRVKSLIKVRTLRENLERAYLKLSRITGYTEETLNHFDPLGFDLEAFLEGLAGRLVKRGGWNSDLPENLFMHVSGQEHGFLYSLDEGFSTKRLKVEGAGMPAPEYPHEKVFNRSEAIPAELAESFPFLAPALGHVGVLNNLVLYVSSGVSVAAFNYHKEVDRFEAQVLKGLTLHGSFFHSLSRQVKNTEDAFRYTTGALARASEVHDEDTGDHIVRVNEYSRLLAVSIGMPKKFVEDISFSAQMHDVGKIYVSEAILNKPGKLTPEEWDKMKNHTTYGAKILGEHPSLAMSRNIALTHHERYDGTGYPAGLKGEEIPIEGRIVNLADQYDALRSTRPYKPAFSHEVTAGIIINGDERTSSSHFDPRVLAAFVELNEEFREVYDRFRD